MAMVVNSEFEFGQQVYLKTDKGQDIRIVTAICVRGNGNITYELHCGVNSSWHYNFEISAEKNVLISTTN